AALSSNVANRARGAVTARGAGGPVASCAASGARRNRDVNRSDTGLHTDQISPSRTRGATSPKNDQSVTRSGPHTRAAEGPMLRRTAVGTSDQGHHRRSVPSKLPKCAVEFAEGIRSPHFNGP